MKDIMLFNPQPTVLKSIFAESLMYANPPLGLGYIASVLRQHNYDVGIYDIGPQEMKVSDVISEIKKENCSIVGISSIIGNHGNAMRLAKAIREAIPDITLVVGGPHASFIPEEVMKQGDVDVIVRFEGEETIVEVMDALSNNNTHDLKKVAGIAYRENGAFHVNELRPLIKDLDSIPFPSWDLFPLECYMEPGIVLTGRGCPYSCIFCAASVISGSKYRARSTKNVVDEIEYMYTDFNIDHMFIADDTFTAIKEHCIDICRQIRERNLDISWEAEARANTVTKEIAEEMARAGCIHVQIGAESGDNDILKALKKNITTDMIEKAVKTMLSHGISVVCSFIIGNPFDTYESVRKTIDFACKLHELSPTLVTCKFAMLTPLPGTPVYEKRDEFNLNLLSDNWDLYTFYDPIVETEHLKRRDLQNLYLEAWMSYIDAEKVAENEQQ